MKVKIDRVEKKCGEQWIITIICVTLYPTGLSDLKFNEAINSHEIPLNFTYSQKS